MDVLFSFSNFSLCLLNTSKNDPQQRWSSYSIILGSGLKPCLKRQWYRALIFYFLFHKMQDNGRHGVLLIPSPDGIIGIYFLSQVCVHTYLSQFLTYMNKSFAALSQCGAHEIDVRRSDKSVMCENGYIHCKINLMTTETNNFQILNLGQIS